MFDCVTVGGASRDVFFMTSKGRIIEDPRSSKKLIAFGYGSKIIPETAKFTYGGGGANSATCFARLGIKVSSLLSIGIEGTGSLLINDLAEAGVDTTHVIRNHNHHTALSIIVGVPGRDHTMFLYRGANDHLIVHDWRSIKTKWFYLSSLTGDSADIIPELFAYASAHNICIAWNPGSEQLELGYHDLANYIEFTDTLILNRDEAMKLVLSKDNRLEAHDVKHLFSALSEMTKGIIIITDGGNGSYAYDHNEIYHQPAHKANRIETTGAGDAYGATFIAGRFLGLGISAAMKMAAHNAANVIQHIGAQEGLMNFDALHAKIKNGD